MQATTTLIALSLLLAAAGAAAAETGARPEPFPQGWYVAPMFSFTKADADRAAGNGTGGWLALGHRGEVAAIELSGIYTPLSGDATLAGGALNLLLGPYSQVPLIGHLYGLVGFGALQERHLAVLQTDHSSAVFGDAGIGYLQPFPLFGLRPSVRLEARYRYDYIQPPHADNTPSAFQDWVFNLGLQIPLSVAKREPPHRTEPVQVVPPVAPAPTPKSKTPEHP